MVIIEGLDGVGKTTLVDYLVENGLKKYHFDYDENNLDIYTKYINVLNQDTKNLVFDRSFISEMVYGPVLRKKCKLSLDQYTKLLYAYKECNSSIIYLTSPKDILLLRRANDIKDYQTILNYYEQLNEQYNRIMDYNENIIDVLRYDSHSMGKEEIQSSVKRLVLK